MQEGLKECVTVERQYGALMKIQTDYNGLGKIQYLLGQQKIPLLDAQYEENVKMKILLPVRRFREVETAITESTNGKAQIEKQEEMYFALLDGRILTGSDMVQKD